VSTRDYAGVLDEVCDGYGIQKSSVSRHWKAASRQQLQPMLERPLGDLDLCVRFLDGKEFHDFTLIVAMGVDRQGRKHVLGLWSGATENAEVCGALLDDLIARGLSADKPYLFILDGAKALKKAVASRFGAKGLIQRCRVYKKRNIQKYLPQKYHGMLALKLRMAWGLTAGRIPTTSGTTSHQLCFAPRSTWRVRLDRGDALRTRLASSSVLSCWP